MGGSSADPHYLNPYSRDALKLLVKGGALAEIEITQLRGTLPRP